MKVWNINVIYKMEISFCVWILTYNTTVIYDNKVNGIQPHWPSSYVQYQHENALISICNVHIVSNVHIIIYWAFTDHQSSYLQTPSVYVVSDMNCRSELYIAMLTLTNCNLQTVFLINEYALLKLPSPCIPVMKLLANSFVQIVFTDGLIQAFSEKSKRASIVSSETGTVMISERMDKMLTVIDAIKLVTISIESRPAIFLNWCFFPDIRSTETLCMTCEYKTTINVKVRILDIVYIIEKGRERDLPSKTQAELTSSLSVTVIERLGRRNETELQRTRANMACFVVKPCFWKGRRTMHMNLSMAISNVIMLEAFTDVIIITPAILQM